MNTQANAALNIATQQSFAQEAEYIVTVMENGVVCYEELDTIVLDFGTV